MKVKNIKGYELLSNNQNKDNRNLILSNDKTDSLLTITKSRLLMLNIVNFWMVLASNTYKFG